MCTHNADWQKEESCSVSVEATYVASGTPLNDTRRPCTIEHIALQAVCVIGTDVH